MGSYLLEIGCEELPPKAVDIAEEHISKNLEQKLKDFFEYETPENIRRFATPRRIAILVKNLKEKEEDKEITILGPPAKVSFDKEGKFTKAALAFANKNNIPIENLKVIKTEKGEYLGAVVLQKGKETTEHLKEVIPEILSSIPFPKTMKWNNTGVRFSRPIRWIVSLWNESVVEFEFGGVRADRFTHLHRFMTQPVGRGEKKEVTHPENYEEIMKLGYIVPNFEDRKKAVETQITGFASNINAEPILDNELIEEVTNLVEFPIGILGDFSPEYLVLPKEVIITVCKSHQRYFNFEKDGKLIPKFLAFSNTAVKDRTVLQRGYEKVLKARLEDALFFYEEDLKHNLEDFYPKLEGIQFHEKLGTMLDKVKRNGEIAVLIADEIGIEDIKSLERANKLSKCDLLTEMVKEFDELQGIIGMHYALKQGEEEKVAKAIYEHYLPKTADDDLPETDIGTALALADKLDTILSFFSIGERPKTGADPFGLRRNAVGIVRILVEKGIDLNLKDLIERIIVVKDLANLYKRTILNKKTDEKIEIDIKSVKDEVLDFILGRFQGYMSSKGFPTDIVNAVISTKDFNLYRNYLKIKAISDMKQNPEFDEIMTVFKRVGKIIPEGFKEKFNKNLLKEKEEIQLYQEFQKIEKEVEKDIEEKNYEKGLKDIVSLKSFIDNFFDNVMVMVKEEEIKENRLSLLKKINELFKKIADFTKINA